MSTEKEKAISVIDEDVIGDDALAVIGTLPLKTQRFINLYLTGQYTINKLAQVLEVHPNTIHGWMRRDDVKLAISEMQNATNLMVTVQLKNLTTKATDKLSKLMDSPIDGVALQAVKDVLDRAGHKAKQEIKVEKTIHTFEEKLNSLVSATIIDAEFEGVDE